MSIPLGSAWAGVELRLDKLEAGVQAALKDMEGLERGMKARAESIKTNVGRELETLGRTLALGVAAPLAALGTAAIKAATDMDSLKRGLTAVSGSSRETERQLVRLKEVAKLPGLGFEEAVRGSIRLQAAGMSAKEAERNLMAFGNAIAIVGGGKNELDRVTFSLTQLANRTTGFGEEIRELQTNLPQIRQIMLKVFGTADSELIGKAGITGRQFVDAIAKEFEKLPKMTSGIKNSFENASDAAKQALAKIGETALPAVASALDSISDKLAGFQKWWVGLSDGARKAILGTGGIVAVFSIATLAVGTFITKVAEAATAIKALVTSTAFGAVSKIAFPASVAAAQVYTATTQPRSAAAASAMYGPTGGAFLPSSMGGAAAALTPIKPSPIRPAQVTLETMAGRFQKSIADINQELMGQVITQARRAALMQSREALIRDAHKLGLMIPGVDEFGDAGGSPYRKMIAALQGKKDQAAAEKARRKVEAAAAKAKREQEKAQKTRDEAIDAYWQSIEDWNQSMQEEADSLKKSFGGTEAELKQKMAEHGARMLGENWRHVGGALDTSGLMAIYNRAKLQYQLRGMGLGGAPFGIPNLTNVQAQQQAAAVGPGIMQSLQSMADRIAGGVRSAERVKVAFKEQFDWMREFSMNLADEFYEGFASSLERLFGKNPLGRALARTLDKWFSSMLDNALASLFGGGKGGIPGLGTTQQIGKGGIWGTLGQIALGSLGGSLLGGIFKGIGNIFKFDDPLKDRSALRWGYDFGSLFTKGALTGAGAAAGAGSPSVIVNLNGTNIHHPMDVERVSEQIAWQIARKLPARPGA